MAIWETTPADHGYDARVAGSLLCENVYPPNTVEAGQWASGWWRADEHAGAEKELVAGRA